MRLVGEREMECCTRITGSTAERLGTRSETTVTYRSVLLEFSDFRGGCGDGCGGGSGGSSVGGCCEGSEGGGGGGGRQCSRRSEVCCVDGCDGPLTGMTEAV